MAQLDFVTETSLRLHTRSPEFDSFASQTLFFSIYDFPCKEDSKIGPCETYLTWKSISIYGIISTNKESSGREKQFPRSGAEVVLSQEVEVVLVASIYFVQRGPSYKSVLQPVRVS